MEGNVPEIRLKGFTGAWVQRKLGDIAGIFDGTHQTPNYVEDGIMFLSVENINTLTSNKFISETDYIKDFKVVPEYGDVLMTRIGDIGTANVIRTHEKLAYYVSLALLKPKNADSDFLAASIHSPAVQKELWEKTLHVAFPKKINLGEIQNISIQIPEIEEQAAIGEFFRTLDENIILHKQKLDGLRKLKKGYLQQMFPQAGETVPRVRFDGFTELWVQRKLGDIAEFSKGNGYSKSDLTTKGTPIILYGRLYTKYETVIEDVDTFAEIKEKSVISQGGEVIVPSSGETSEDISRASVVSKAGIILGGDINVVKPNAVVYPVFLAITISNGSQQKELTKRAQGKSIVHISNADLKEVILQLPTLPEQTAIGSFFYNLDNQITTQNQKVEQLKQLKAAYLQKMFV